MKNIVSGLLILASVTLHSQSGVINGGAGHFRFGYANYNLKVMNNWLPDRQPTLKNDFIMIGGGGYGIINNVVVGGEGLGARGTVVTKDTLSITPTMGMGIFNIGYVIFQSNKLLVYPMFGIGGAGSSFSFKETDNMQGPINKVKNDPYELSSSNLMISFAIGADQFFMFGEEDGGISIGLRAGYTYALRNRPWRSDNDEVGGPNLNLSGFYFTIGIGGGGWSPDKPGKNEQDAQTWP